MITLDRNKIYEIGKDNIKTIKIQAIDKKTNDILEEFNVYECIRRKNKLYLRAYEGKAKLTFKNLRYAKKYQIQIKEILLKEIE